MIITRTPFRISFFGGGTDYPVYYNEQGGAVLNTTINKYCYITCRYLPPFFDHKFRARYMGKRELTQTVDEIQHPSVRECLKFVGIDSGIEMVHTSDIPAMSGIGSSSSFTVGFLNALYALQGKMVTKRKLALDAIHVEQNLVGECVGSQDQTAAAFGGFNRIEFGGSDGIFVQPITIGMDKVKYFQECLLFCFVGFSRYSSEIANRQIEKTPGKLIELKAMCQMVDEGMSILNSGSKSLNDFGKLLHETWMIKRGLTKLISSDEIDDIYETARRAGALGGKLCGAGGGGFFVFFVPPENREKVRESLRGLLHVPIRLETLGSHIIFHTAEYA
ncbi:D-glycero-alpha-D-manno-heptose 7-phosphate kinase (EC [Olavius sp. associated proteobacterium Delta 1]|nr:D-glycero-alpha-D-manno-heptose 7-phosphate kinase (EC [Olavius sp. associated proteobacterium Delta 1]